MLLSDNGDSSSHPGKLLSNREGSINDNRTLLLLPKLTGGTICPAVLADTPACRTAQPGISAVIAGSDPTEAKVETAVAAYLAACKASQCQSTCQTLIPKAGVAVGTPATFATNFDTACPLAPIVSTLGVTCTTATPNGETCTTLYNDVLTVVKATTWVPADIKAKVDLFTAGCLTTSCIDACKTVVSAVDLGSPYTSFQTNFVASCNPDKKNDGDGNEGDLGIMDIKLSLLMLLIVTGTSLFFSLFDW
jgi:hypothetical protein